MRVHSLLNARIVVQVVARYGKDAAIWIGYPSQEIWKAIDMVRTDNLMRSIRRVRRDGAALKRVARAYAYLNMPKVAGNCEAYSRREYRYATKLQNKLDTLRLVTSQASFESSRIV